MAVPVPASPSTKVISLRVDMTKWFIDPERQSSSGFINISIGLLPTLPEREKTGLLVIHYIIVRANLREKDIPLKDTTPSLGDTLQPYLRLGEFPLAVPPERAVPQHLRGEGNLPAVGTADITG